MCVDTSRCIFRFKVDNFNLKFDNTAKIMSFGQQWKIKLCWILQTEKIFVASKHFSSWCYLGSVLWLAGWNANFQPRSRSQQFPTLGRDRDHGNEINTRQWEKQDGGWTMVEKQQDFSDVKGCEVDVFRDTALRYLGECFIYCNEIVMKNSRPRVPCTWSFAHRCCSQIGERLARYSIAQFLSV